MAERNKIMHISRSNWEPGFGEIFTWFAMDKNGKIAVMVNNCWGWLPETLLVIPNFEDLLDDLNEYKWQESEKYASYPAEKNGETILDLYSSLLHGENYHRQDVEFWVKSKQNSEDLNEINMPSKKGFFIYHSLEGDNAGKYYPVGYNRETKIGDYFRYLMPTVYASINDFPTELHHGIAVSDTVDFTADRLFDNEKISEYFPKMYR